LSLTLRTPSTLEVGVTYVVEPQSYTQLIVRVLSPLLRGNVRLERARFVRRSRRAASAAPWEVKNVYICHRSNRSEIAQKRADKIGEEVRALIEAWSAKHRRTLVAADRRFWREAVSAKKQRLSSLVEDTKKTRRDLRTATWMVEHEKELVYP
jgi:hypothetical protein